MYGNGNIIYVDTYIEDCSNADYGVCGVGYSTTNHANWAVQANNGNLYVTPHTVQGMGYQLNNTTGTYALPIWLMNQLCHWTIADSFLVGLVWLRFNKTSTSSVTLTKYWKSATDYDANRQSAGATWAFHPSYFNNSNY